MGSFIEGIKKRYPGLADPKNRKTFGIMLIALGFCIILIVFNSRRGNSASVTPEEEGVEITTPQGVDQEEISGENQYAERSAIMAAGRTMAEEIYNSAGGNEGVDLTEHDDDSKAEGAATSEGEAEGTSTPKSARDEANEWLGLTPANVAKPSGEEPQDPGTQGAVQPQQTQEPRVVYVPQENSYTGTAVSADPQPAEAPANTQTAGIQEGTVEVLPGTSVRQSGGISSLDDEWGTLSGVSSLGNESVEMNTRSHPFEVMFSRDEKVTSGGRVMLRLLEEMVVDGVRIPKNSPLSGIVSVGSNRLSIVVPALKVNDKIYSLNMVAYDTDGIEGLYCPQSNVNRAAKEGKREAGGILRSALQSGIAGYAGQVVSSGAQIIQSNSGDVTITISAGYKFYLMRSER